MSNNDELTSELEQVNAHDQVFGKAALMGFPPLQAYKVGAPAPHPYIKVYPILGDKVGGRAILVKYSDLLRTKQPTPVHIAWPECKGKAEVPDAEHLDPIVEIQKDKRTRQVKFKEPLPAGCGLFLAEDFGGLAEAGTPCEFIRFDDAPFPINGQIEEGFALIKLKVRDQIHEAWVRACKLLTRLPELRVYSDHGEVEVGDQVYQLKLIEHVSVDYPFEVCGIGPAPLVSVRPIGGEDHTIRQTSFMHLLKVKEAEEPTTLGKARMRIGDGPWHEIDFTDIAFHDGDDKTFRSFSDIPNTTGPTRERKHAHYFKACPYPEIDVYRVIDLFGITDPCIQHALKKLLAAGVRGAKDTAKDIGEAIDTLERWQDMRDEERLASMEDRMEHNGFTMTMGIADRGTLCALFQGTAGQGASQTAPESGRFVRHTTKAAAAGLGVPYEELADHYSELAASACVHPKGPLGDEGGSPCCPLTGTRDASLPKTPRPEFEKAMGDLRTAHQQQIIGCQAALDQIRQTFGDGCYSDFMAKCGKPKDWDPRFAPMAEVASMRVTSETYLLSGEINGLAYKP